MGSAQRTTWISMTAAAAILASLLGFLYVRTQSHDPSIYFENVALLRQLKQLDARWELETVKSRMGINSSYDALVDPLVELNGLREKLQIEEPMGEASSADSLSGASDAFLRAIEEKTRLVEDFKSHNSVLKNSLGFLPAAAEDVQQAIAGIVRTHAGELVSTAVSNALLHSMLYTQAPSDEKAVEVGLQMKRLLTARSAVPSDAQDALDIFALHVATVLREQPVVDDLLERIAAVPVAVGIDAVDTVITRVQQHADVQAQQYRRYLLIFASALVALLMYAAASLVRSHRVINRVNRDLQETNLSLERRVEERTRELHDAQGEVVTTARRAGMAEIANNVLHNVGNVLNSVNVSATLINEKVRNSNIAHLAKAVALINDNGDRLAVFLVADERGRLLPGYLAKLSVALAAEQAAITAELGSLTKSIDHIKDIVSTQQSYAGKASLIEQVQIRELLEDALRINAVALERQQVAIVKEFDDVPTLLLDKSRLLQMLVNLIGNARQAMEDVMDRSRRITLRTRLADHANGRRLRISVEDDGVGISAENLGRLFIHGFTTRKQGHGFGLHSCALAAKEMGGTLTAQSDGPGKGAAFILDLPLLAMEVSQ